MRESKKFKQKRPWWFGVIKTLTKGRYKKPTFVYLGEKPTNGSVILSNHEGTDAPMSLENWADFPIRFWGTVEMNSGLVRLYKYQTKVYYHEKKHWNLFLARLFCLLASPLTYLFYSGLNLISTYQNANLKKTMKESLDAIKNGDNIVIFPERSDEGYLAELKGFYAGFLVLAKVCYKNGIDVPVYVSYFKKDKRIYVFDKPIKYSELKEKYPTRDEAVSYLLNRCNALGKIPDGELLSLTA